jgi:hypothetical protein
VGFSGFERAFTNQVSPFFSVTWEDVSYAVSLRSTGEEFGGRAPALFEFGTLGFSQYSLRVEAEVLLDAIFEMNIAPEPGFIFRRNGGAWLCAAFRRQRAEVKVYVNLETGAVEDEPPQALVYSSWSIIVPGRFTPTFEPLAQFPFVHAKP